MALYAHAELNTHEAAGEQFVLHTTLMKYVEDDSNGMSNIATEM